MRTPTPCRRRPPAMPWRLLAAAAAISLLLATPAGATATASDEDLPHQPRSAWTAPQLSAQPQPSGGGGGGGDQPRSPRDPVTYPGLPAGPLADCPTELDLFRTGRPPAQSRLQLFIEAGVRGAPAAATADVVNCLSPRGPEAHVQYSTEPAEYAGMLASLHSALRNSAAPERLRFHLTVPDDADPAALCERLLAGLAAAAPQYVCPAAAVRSYLPPGVTVPACGAPEAAGAGGAAAAADDADADAAAAGAPPDASCFCGGSPQFHVVRFRPASHALPAAAAMGGSRKDRAALLAPANFARNYADAYLLPRGVRKVVYLDADTIVQGDLVQLWDTPLGGDAGAPRGAFAGVARSCKLKMRQLYDFSHPAVRAAGLRPDDCYVNAGVYVLDLERYAAAGGAARINALVAEHGRRRVWTQGVQQPSFVLALAPNATEVDAAWNTDALGYNPTKPGRAPLAPCALRSGRVLHWNGVWKPWACPPNGAGHDCYRAYWAPYALGGDAGAAAAGGAAAGGAAGAERGDA